MTCYSRKTEVPGKRGRVCQGSVFSPRRATERGRAHWEIPFIHQPFAGTSALLGGQPGHCLGLLPARGSCPTPPIPSGSCTPSRHRSTHSQDLWRPSGGFGHLISLRCCSSALSSVGSRKRGNVSSGFRPSGGGTVLRQTLKGRHIV